MGIGQAAKWVVSGAVLVVVFLLLAGSRYAIIFGGVPDYPHHIQTVVPSAFEVVPGERMVAAGETVGEITSATVTRTGQAHLVMGLDNSEWPLPSDSVLQLRMGGTIKYTDRFINITKGHAGAEFRNNGYVPARQFIAPVEYNSLFDIFNPRTRAGLKSLFTLGGPTIKAAAQPLRSALAVAPPTLGQAAAVFNDLGYDQRALSTLVSATAQLSDAVASSNPGVRQLLQGAGQTFGALASRSAALQNVLEVGGESLRWSGILSQHLTTTLPRLSGLLTRLHPGLTQLDALASPLDGTLREVVNVEPTAVTALQTVQHSGPDLNGLLTSARTALLPQLTSIGRQAAKELDCVRPFTPDIINFFQNWAGFTGDGLTNPHVHLFHAFVSILPFPNDVPLNTEQLHQILPNLSIEYPGLPGEAWNQPWPQPQCGLTMNDVNPAYDPEANTYDTNGSKLVPYPSH
jgi:phospholipid/cholesterol/gamma-HCH transport system substrate-binding protein